MYSSFSSSSMPDNVIETLITPDRPFPVEHLVDPAGRTAVNALKDLAQLVRFNEPKDQMGMIGHYYRGIQVDALLITFQNGRDHQIPSLN